MAALSIEHLSRSFGATRAVQDVSLTVETGDIYGLLGPNGSGKTTTLACALGLLAPDEGRIEILGVPAAQIHRTMGRVGVVFDGATLVDGLTCRQNLQYARRLLGHAGGPGDAELLAQTGIEALADRRAGKLSLGQRRRLSIARALLGRPELIVLDEPLSGLDTVGVRQMLDLFRGLRGKGHTLLVSSHRLHEMETIVNRVAILLGGRLVRQATLDEILEGRRPRLVVRATPLAAARAVLAALPGLERVEPGPASAEEGSLTVWPGTLAAAAINRALVTGGCDVDVLTLERTTLQSAFESLVDDARARGVTVPA
jgi:ABC-2 type transport system ATP-binding protein